MDSFDFADVFVRPGLRCRTLRGEGGRAGNGGEREPPRRQAAVSGTFGGRPLAVPPATVSRAAASARFRARLRIRNPRLWSPEQPRLYTVKLQLRHLERPDRAAIRGSHRHPQHCG